MIIFGTRYTRKLVQEGQFHCHCCDEDTTYQIRQPRKWFHLYWIPIVPLLTHEPYLECGACRNQLSPEMAPDRQAERMATARRDASRAMLNAAAFVVLRIKDETPGTREAILTALNMTGANQFSVGDLDTAFSEMAGPDSALTDLLTPIADIVSEHFKETALRALYALIVRNQELTRETCSLLIEAGLALHMSPAHIRGTMQEAMTPPQLARELA